MSGDNLGLRACHRDHLLRDRNHHLHRSAMLKIDEGIGAIEISIAHVHHTGVDKLDDRTSSDMGIRRTEYANYLAVQVKRAPVRENHNRQCGLGRHRYLASEGFQGLIGVHQLTHTIMHDDRYTGLTQILVVARMVKASVGIEHEAYRSIADRLDDRHNPRRQRRKLVVDHKNTVRSHGNANIHALPQQPVNSLTEIGRLNLNRTYVLSDDWHTHRQSQNQAANK